MGVSNVIRGTRFVLMGLAMIVVSVPGKAEDRPWAILPKGLGPIQIGMPIERAVALARGAGEVKETKRMNEGETTQVYETSRAGQRHFVLEPAMGMVYRIAVWSSAYRDTKGAGVGTTLAALQKHYPGITLGHGEGNTCGFVRHERMGHSFCFSGMKPSPSTKVSHIFIVGVDDV